MNISKRLKAISNLVDTKRIIDVGCDHGYLDIYLTLYKDCTCIASDISKSAMKCCRENMLKFNLNDKIETIITNGINNIEINKEDTIILSGMGTNTIIDILSNKDLSDTIIISSNNHLEELRRFMVSIGYYILDEVYVLEHGIHYVIIKFRKGNRKYTDFDYILGPIVIKDNDYKKYILNQYKDILRKIPYNHVETINKYKKIINYIEN